jgi:hypothetical protein
MDAVQMTELNFACVFESLTTEVHRTHNNDTIVVLSTTKILFKLSNSYHRWGPCKQRCRVCVCVCCFSLKNILTCDESDDQPPRVLCDEDGRT